MTILEAENQVIFYTENGNVIESSLMSYLSEYGQRDDTSAVEESEETVYMVDGNDFDSEDEAIEYCEENKINSELIEEGIITNYSHVVRYHANYGRKVKGSQHFGQDQESAEAAYIQGLEWFVSEKNWDAPQYFDTHELADADRIERASEGMEIDTDVFVSIERKQKLVKAIRDQRAADLRMQNEAEKAVIFERYKNLISRVDPETYKETEARLTAALPIQINGSVFHKIIKHIRK